MQRYRSDPALIQLCLAGDEAAWHSLVDRYSRLVYSIPRSYGFDVSDAEDIVQEVFTTLFRCLETLRDRTRLSSWLITTTHRACWRQGKDRAVGVPIDASPETEDPNPDRAAVWSRAQDVREALERLGGRCRDLLEALFLAPDRPDYTQIAERLGMRIGSIGPTRARCFRKFEEILEQMGYGRDEP
jgi:RNA polymerase sigma factor (sigma-70 family)